LNTDDRLRFRRGCEKSGVPETLGAGRNDISGSLGGPAG
jgi:hypothetical protein